MLKRYGLIIDLDYYYHLYILFNKSDLFRHGKVRILLLKTLYCFIYYLFDYLFAWNMISVNFKS
jgi:hypothetical protein